jgi:hypothetical protein
MIDFMLFVFLLARVRFEISIGHPPSPPPSAADVARSYVDRALKRRRWSGRPRRRRRRPAPPPPRSDRLPRGGGRQRGVPLAAVAILLSTFDGEVSDDDIPDPADVGGGGTAGTSVDGHAKMQTKSQAKSRAKSPTCVSQVTWGPVTSIPHRDRADNKDHAKGLCKGSCQWIVHNQTKIPRAFAVI